MSADIAALSRDLTYAKDAVRWLLNRDIASVDQHGLKYWAGRVEEIRAQIKAAL